MALRFSRVRPEVVEHLAVLPLPRLPHLSAVPHPSAVPRLPRLGAPASPAPNLQARPRLLAQRHPLARLPHPPSGAH